jgi:4-diphosphocytidyl-2-C-methyl-D-erythritol kinase
MIVFPNAKINLGLNILSRREDGYHNIESVMVPVGWCDILEVVATDEPTSLVTTGRHVDCPPEKNLVMKAYRAVAERHDIGNVAMHLHKVIPDGAGLGGGSADAAFAIRALNDLFSLGMDDAAMAAIAATVGADCPFFIYNRPMLATSTGVELAPYDIDLSAYNVAIVKPSTEAVSTARAYAGVTPRQPECGVAELLRDANPVNWRESVKNDFEDSIFPIIPRLNNIKQSLYDAGADYCAMSGSGSSIFAIFARDILSEELAAMFADCDTHLDARKR